MAIPNTGQTAAEISALLRGKKRIWFIGIGGVHMSALARLSRDLGFEVAGSDAAQNEHTRRLLLEGISVYPCHDAAQMAGFDAVVYTLAISFDNPEYRAAVRLGLPLFSRADYLGFLMSTYPRRIGVAGSHGKSTVTAMLAEIFTVAVREPTVFCGARMRRFDSTYLRGATEEFIFEACEYMNSFLSLSPTVAVLLNAEFDHADFFEDKEAVLASFKKFAALAGECVILPEWDTALRCAVGGTAAPQLTFGRGAGADCRASEIEIKGGVASFLLSLPSGASLPVTLSVPGEYNIENALAAATAADFCGIAPHDIAKGLSGFQGAARRMEYRGMACGARIFEDDAHHPTEVAAAIAAAKGLCAETGRVFVVFQPHTYSRTAALFSDFCCVLRAAQRVIVTDIYAAREIDTLDMSGERLAAGIGGNAAFGESLSATVSLLLEELSAGDVVLVMGAGDIGRIFREFSRKGFTIL